MMEAQASNTIMTMEDLIGVFDGASALPKLRYKVEIADRTCIHVATMPNAWIRFWQRVLLGWTWTELAAE